MQVLALFHDQDFALAHADVEEQVGANIDRVTAYRILGAFEEKGLIHQIHDGSGVTKYALCREECSEEEHQDEHVHFHCTRCGKSYCFEHVPVPQVELPAAFEQQEVYLMAHGICRSCKQ